MRQVDKKFLEEQVRLALKNQNNPEQLEEAVQAALIVGGVIVASALTCSAVVQGWQAERAKEIAAKSKTAGSVITILNLIADFLVGSWDYSYRAAANATVQKFKYGISPAGYISSAMDAYKGMDPLSRTVFRFVDAKPAIDDSGEVDIGGIRWKEEIFNSIRGTIKTKYQSRILKILSQAKFVKGNPSPKSIKKLGSVIEDFMDDAFDVLDKHGVSDKRANLLNNIYAFGLLGDQTIDRDMKVMFRPERSWCEQEAKILLRSFEKSEQNFKANGGAQIGVSLEGMVMGTNHLFFSKGYSSFNELMCSDSDFNLANIAVLAIHAKSVEQQSDWAVVGLALFDIVFSLLTTLVMFGGGAYAKVGVKAVTALFAKQAIKFATGRAVVNSLKGLAGSINSQSKFAKASGVMMNSIVMAIEGHMTFKQDYGYLLKKLEVYHKVYFSILQNNKFDRRDIETMGLDIKDYGIGMDYIGGIFSALYQNWTGPDEEKMTPEEKLEFQQQQSVAAKEEKEEAKRHTVFFTNSEEDQAKKNELLNQLLYGNTGSFRDGIKKTYSDLFDIQFMAMRNQANAVAYSLGTGEQLALPPEKDNKGKITAIAKVVKAYKQGNSTDAENMYESVMWYTDKINEALDELRKIKKTANSLPGDFSSVKERQSKKMANLASSARKQLSTPCLDPASNYSSGDTMASPDEGSADVDASPAVDDAADTDTTYADASPVGTVTGTTDDTGQDQVEQPEAPAMAELDPIDVIIIGDSNANGMLGYFKGNTNRTKHVVRNGFSVAAILKLLKAHFKKNYPSLSEQTAQKRTPKAAIIHMGYNGPENNLQAMKDTVVFLQEKGIKDIRIVDIKVDKPEWPRYQKNIKALSDELKKFPSQYQGVSIIPNNGEISTKKMGGDGFHFTENGYRQIIKDSLGGAPLIVPTSGAGAAAAAAAAGASSVVTVTNPRATEMISDVKKYLGGSLSDSQTQNLENIYKAVISELSFIKDKNSWNAYRYAVGTKESGRTYNPYKATGAWRKNRYTGRYAIGPGPYKTGRQVVSKYGVVLPGYKYIGDRKWSPGSQEKYYNDPVAQEGSFAGFVIYNKNVVKPFAKDSKDELSLPGIAHNIGPGGMEAWVRHREEYRKTKDVKHLYRMWSLQDGYGTPGENFMRILLRQTGQKIPDLPLGWMWQGKNKDYNKIEQIRQFDQKLGNYLEKGWPFCKGTCDPRIFALTKDDYAERVWNWIMNSGQAYRSKRNSNKSKNIQDYYNENGDPIGSPVGGFSLGGNIASEPGAKPGETGAKPSSEAGSDILSFLQAGAEVSAEDAEKRLTRRIERVKDIEDFYELTTQTQILYGIRRNTVYSSYERAESLLDEARTEDVRNYANIKFQELKEMTHRPNRAKFFKLFNDTKQQNEEQANELMAYLHRPRILIHFPVSRFLYTGKSTYSLSLELGPPYAGKIGVINQRHSFFDKKSFEDSIEKQNLFRIFKMNKETFQALYEKLDSFGAGQVEVKQLTFQDKEKYMSIYKSFVGLFDESMKALKGEGSTLRKAIILEKLARAAYIIG